MRHHPRVSKQLLLCQQIIFLPKLFLNISRSVVGLFNIDTSAIDDSHPPDALRSGISDFRDADFFTSLQPDILESLLVFACISFRVTFLFWACGSLRVTTIPNCRRETTEVNHSVRNKFRWVF
jgi:hypothetical protein